jgi:hypothetical protein
VPSLAFQSTGSDKSIGRTRGGLKHRTSSRDRTAALPSYALAPARGIGQAAEMTDGRVILVARFDGNVDALIGAYDKAHDVIMSRGGAVPIGELRHHCATSHDALYIIGVWTSEAAVRARWSTTEFTDLLKSVGFPPTPSEMTILELHAIEPPLG